MHFLIVPVVALFLILVGGHHYAEWKRENFPYCWMWSEHHWWESQPEAFSERCQISKNKKTNEVWYSRSYVSDIGDCLHEKDGECLEVIDPSTCKQSPGIDCGAGEFDPETGFVKCKNTVILDCSLDEPTP